MGSNINRYGKNWEEIAFLIKKQAGWKCSKCSLQCLKPEDDTSNLTKTERTRRTLNVHHANYTPEDNRSFNLIPLCTSCHLSYHNRRQGNTTPGQLSLWTGLKEVNYLGLKKK
jgi:Fe-S-cluster-containing dehydrogenase component